MPNEFINAERIASTSLGLLERETRFANMIWRNAAGDFRGAKDDVISIRLPAYAKANKRTLRAGTQRSETALTERVVPITLDDNIYIKIPLTDEEQTLDILEYEQQVVAPALRGVAREIESEAIALATGATYENDHQLTLDPQAPY